MKNKTTGEHAGYSTGEMTFYHVSAKKKFIPESDKPMLPKRKFKIKVKLKLKFEFAYESQGEYLMSTMPVQFLRHKESETQNNWKFDPIKKCVVIGAIVCEASGTNELATSFFSSTYNSPCD